MGKINWDKSMSIDNEVIDSQHKELIELYNALHESILNDSDQKAIETKMATLYGLMEYTSYHFKSEEEYMESINFPELDLQQKNHQQFKDKIAAFIQEAENNQTVLPTSIIKLIRNWIVDHISTEDVKIGRFAKQEPLEKKS